MSNSSKGQSLILRFSAIFIYMGLLTGVSLFIEGQKAKELVHQYVQIWEDDIAEAKIFEADSSLQNKIIQQLYEVHPSVFNVTIAGSGTEGPCWKPSLIPLTYNGLPSGSVRVCFSPGQTFGSTVTSPLFFGGLLLGVLFLLIYIRRDALEKVRAQQLKVELYYNQRLAKMSRQVAHDIRGPLTALMTLAKLRGHEDEQKQQLLGLAAERIKAIADELLRSAQDTDGSANEAVIAEEVMTSLKKESAELLREYRAIHPDIHFHFVDHLSIEDDGIRLDKLKLQRVLSNIVNNAIEALPDEQPCLSITLTRKYQSLNVLIMDNGYGIPEEEISKVLEEGYSRGKDSGNGLGLYDAYETMKKIGGDLQLRSRVGVGTQVLLVFPLNASVESLESAAL